MSNGYRVNWPMRIASVLLCLVLLTTCLSSGLYARYTVSGTSSDSARVIKFGEVTLTETGDFVKEDNINKYVITPGVNLIKDVEVDFGGSESSTYVFVEMILSNGWDTEDNYHFVYGNDYLVFDINKYDSSSTTGWNLVPGTSYVYYIELDPNTPLTDYDVIANINDDTKGDVVVSTSIIKSIIESLNNISIKFQATVVQSNGFNSVTDAWNSINSKKGV